MKKGILSTMLITTLGIVALVGCGNAEHTNVTEIETVEEATEVETEAPHEHTYTEAITVEATCTTEGEKTFTCECGDTYTEAISATGHDFAEYVSNEDATYEADGTETATCSVCGETDTRVAEGSMLTYTFEDMEATKYAKSTVNVRSLPNTDGEKLGGLSTNDEVKVTGKCNETGWYRIEYSDGVAYVSDSYLVDNKVETKPAEAPASNSGSTASASSGFPYQLYTVYDNGSCAWIYMTHTHGYSDTYWNAFNACHDLNKSLCGGAPSADICKAASSSLGLSYNIGNDATPWKTESGDRIYIYYAW